jgi:hypothetical protein
MTLRQKATSQLVKATPKLNTYQFNLRVSMPFKKDRSFVPAINAAYKTSLDIARVDSSMGGGDSWINIAVNSEGRTRQAASHECMPKLRKAVVHSLLNI